MNNTSAIQKNANGNTPKRQVSLDAETLFEWLDLQPGQKRVATRIDDATAILSGLRIRLQKTVDGRKIGISLDEYTVKPETGAKTDPVLRLSFEQSRTGNGLKLRQVQWRQQRVTVTEGDQEALLADVARISHSLRRQYLPSLQPLYALFMNAVTEKDA